MHLLRSIKSLLLLKFPCFIFKVALITYARSAFFHKKFLVLQVFKCLFFSSLRWRTFYFARNKDKYHAWEDGQLIQQENCLINRID